MHLKIYGIGRVYEADLKFVVICVKHIRHVWRKWNCEKRKILWQ